MKRQGSGGAARPRLQTRAALPRIVLGLVGITASIVVVGGSPATAADSAPEPGFTLTAEFVGLFPGADLTVPVIAHNEEQYTLVVQAADVAVGDASPQCPASNVIAHSFSGEIQIPAGGSATIPVRMQMSAAAPNSCQGATFPLRFDATGQPLDPTSPSGGFAFTGFGVGGQLLAGAGALAVAIGVVLVAVRRGRVGIDPDMRRYVAILVAGFAFAFVTTSAGATWSPGASGSGTATARSLGLATSALAAATGSSSIHVSWNAPTGGSVTPTGYVVRRTAPSTTTVCTVGGTTFACDDTGLNGGTAYTYTLEAKVGSSWSSGQTAGTSATTNGAGNILVSVSGTKTAGTAFAPTLTATTNGVTTDTAYAGVKTITFSGPDASPSGTNPTYPATVTFIAGVATPSLTLYNAATATLSVTDGSLSGSASVTVVAGAASRLGYTTSSPSCSTGSVVVGNAGSFTSRVSIYDAYLNLSTQAASRSVTLTRSAPTGTLSPTSLTIAAGSSETSASLTFSLPSGNPPDTTITAASTGVTSVACIVKKN